MEICFDAETSYKISSGELSFSKAYLSTIEDPENYGKGRNGLRQQILFDIWSDFFGILQKYRCKSIQECHDCVITLESFLILITEDIPLSQFCKGFSQLAFNAMISGNLKVAVVQYLSRLAKQYNMLKFVFCQPRETIEFNRSLDIVWGGQEMEPFSTAIKRQDYIKMKKIEDLKQSKNKALNEFDIEVKAKQEELVKKIKTEVQEEFANLQQTQGQIPLSDVATLTQEILKTKMAIFNSEIKSSFDRLQLSIDLDMEIFKTLKAKDDLKEVLSPSGGSPKKSPKSKKSNK